MEPDVRPSVPPATPPAVPVPAPPAVPISDLERERGAELLQRACGEGRLTLEEFSVRVGEVWASDTAEQLQRATTGFATPAQVLNAQVVAVGDPVRPAVRDNIVNVFGESKRRGRWRLPARLRVTNVFGSCELDLCAAALDADAMSGHAVSITGRNVFGELKVIVPEGVEVELTGAVVFGARSLQLAPVAPFAGTPVIRIHVTTVFGEVSVRSRGVQQRPQLGGRSPAGDQSTVDRSL
jgi:hypothetical protein